MINKRLLVDRHLKYLLCLDAPLHTPLNHAGYFDFKLCHLGVNNFDQAIYFFLYPLVAQPDKLLIHRSHLASHGIYNDLIDSLHTNEVNVIQFDSFLFSRKLLVEDISRRQLHYWGQLGQKDVKEILVRLGFQHERGEQRGIRMLEDGLIFSKETGQSKIITGLYYYFVSSS